MATLNTTNTSTCGTQSDFQVAEGSTLQLLAFLLKNVLFPYT